MTRPDRTTRLFRRAKTDPQGDLRHTLALGLPLALMLFLALPVLFSALNHATEARWYRDLVAITPFHGVTVSDIRSTARGAAVSGQMIKRRCEYVSLSAYIRNGLVWERAAIDTSPEDQKRPPGNRPSLPDAQLWGPWVILWSAPPVPLDWVIYAHHRCPEGDQVNEFARGPWPG